MIFARVFVAGCTQWFFVLFTKILWLLLKNFEVLAVKKVFFIFLLLIFDIFHKVLKTVIFIRENGLPYPPLPWLHAHYSMTITLSLNTNWMYRCAFFSIWLVNKLTFTNGEICYEEYIMISYGPNCHMEQDSEYSQEKKTNKI